MKHLRVAEARARFGELLDSAEQGNPVVVERRGVRFRIVADSPAAEQEDAQADGGLFEFVDPAVLTGKWTWESGPKGLKFSPRRKRR